MLIFLYVWLIYYLNTESVSKFVIYTSSQFLSQWGQIQGHFQIIFISCILPSDISVHHL